VNQPHEGVASPDGKTLHAAIPNGPHVVIDLKTMTVAARHKVGVNPFGGGLRLTTRP
jgi:DNA-binding beta-propeller fold protein YncE